MQKWIGEKLEDLARLWDGVLPPYYDLCPIGIWAGDKDYAAYLSLESGKLLGFYRHDLHGKWDIVIYVSIWRALTIIWNHPAGIASWSPFPRCAVWVFRAKSQHSARMAVEELSGF